MNLSTYRQGVIAVAGPKVDVDSWAKPSVERMQAAGIMVGRTDGTFGGREPITRQEVAVVAERLLRRLEEATSCE